MSLTKAKSLGPREVDGRCVLVVDDDPCVGEIIGLYAQKMKLDPIVVADASYALGLISLLPDLVAVVADRCMPGIGGDALYRHIKQQKIDVEVLLVSGRDGGLPPGAALLLKPFTFDEFRAAMMMMGVLESA